LIADWQSQFGAGAPLAQSLQQIELGRAIPEPTSAALLLLALSIFSQSVHRR